jgi:hypothetical protein
MKWVGYSLLVLVLASPASRGDDPPKDKDGKKEASPKDQYAALAKEYSAKQQAILADYRKAKGEEQQKLAKEYRGLGGEYADRFLKLAEAHPKDPAAADALFWVVDNAPGTPGYPKAVDLVVALIAEMPLKDLVARVGRSRLGHVKLMDAALQRAEKDAKDPLAGDLIAAVAANGRYSDVGPKAAKLLVEKFPDHPAVERVALAAADMRGGEDLLRQILAKSPKPRVEAAARLGLGKALAEKVDGLGDKPAEADKTAAEAEKYLTAAIALYKDDAARKKDAENELRVVRTLRVGKVAPDIKGPDLDGKEFKLSDYRGKVVLLDFWGHW